jgi:hypothetical protein
MTDQPIVEVVLFRIKDGITDAAFLQQAGVVQAWAEQQPGADEGPGQPVA